jgi:DNA-binding transcriptional ArsR family regulator
MVEYDISLDEVFSALADPTRRDILNRTALSELTVSEIAAVYDMSLAAVSKHLKVLEAAGLIMKRRRSRQILVCAVPPAVGSAAGYLQEYVASAEAD